MAVQNIAYKPVFNISPAIARDLMRIEAVKQAIDSLPITPRLLANLRQTARLYSTHYSTMIEGNLLTEVQVAKVIGQNQHFPGRERDEQEVKGYYAALDEVERLTNARATLTEGIIKHLHAFVMGGARPVGSRPLTAPNKTSFATLEAAALFICLPRQYLSRV